MSPDESDRVEDTFAASLIACMGKLGYTFKNVTLLQTALTHTSAVSRGRAEASSYERLEFVGDRVIGLVVAQSLFKAYAEAPAGEMNRRLSSLVRRETLAEVAQEVGIGPHIIMSPGEEDAGGREKPAILADVMEATLGAMYLDGGLPAVEPLVAHYWQHRLAQASTAQRDPKSALQEWSQSHNAGLPTYEVIARKGSDHAPEFVVSCAVMGQVTKATGGSKRAAERAAAQSWLNKYAKDDTA